MAPKKPKPKRKPTGYAKLSQKEKFIAAAKAAGVDETGKTFLRSFKAIVKHKPKGWPK